MTKSLQAWDSFWQTPREGIELSDTGSQDENLESFWQHALKAAIPPLKKVKLLDLASGGGYVVQLANLVHQANPANKVEDSLKTHSVDISLSALQKINRQSPKTYTVCANLNALPYKDASFDIVTSQFGVEYGGLSAIASALRLINETGQLILVCHRENGSIYQECFNNFNQLDLFINSHFIPHFVDAFGLAYSVAEGKVNEDVFQAADKALSLSINKIKSLISTHSNKSQALSVILKLYEDVAYMYQNKHDFNYDEIVLWSKKVQKEMSDYHGRMSSMLDSALGEEEHNALLELLRENSFEISTDQELYFVQNKKLPAAWTVIARKT